MFSRILVMAAMALCLPLTTHAEAAEHLSFEQLMALVPEPNIRPSYDANRNYQSGGIGILVYDGVNAMDAIGPYQVFSTAGLKPMFISASKNGDQYKTTVTTNSGFQISTHRTIANTNNLEVLVVAGGAVETANLAKNAEVLEWIKAIDKTSVWTSSVCTGAWVLGAAGLLEGKKATSNWYHADDILEHFGAIPKSKKRYLFDGKIVTAAGVTAGIDMALAIVQTVYKHDLNDGKDFTQAVMLDLQYDPKPPVEGGSAEKTQPFVYAGMEWMYDLAGFWYGLNQTLADYVKAIVPLQP